MRLPQPFVHREHRAARSGDIGPTQHADVAGVEAADGHEGVSDADGVVFGKAQRHLGLLADVVAHNDREALSVTRRRCQRTPQPDPADHRRETHQ